MKLERKRSRNRSRWGMVGMAALGAVLTLALPRGSRAAPPDGGSNGWPTGSAPGAQPPLTLVTAISEAKEASPEIQRLQAEADVASWKRLEALSAYLPHLSAGLDHFFGAKYARLQVFFGGVVDFPSAFPQTTVNLDASITIFDGLTGYYTYQGARLENEAAQIELSHAKFKLEHEVRNRFYRALAAEELAAVTQENIRTLQDHLGIAKASESSGLGTRFDVLRIEAQLDDAQADAALANDNVVLARRDLAEAMGLERDDPRPLSGELPVPSEKDLPAGLELRANANEAYQAQVKREEAFDEKRKASGGFWFPKVSFFADDQYYRYGDFDPAVLPNSWYRNAYSYGVRLTWNIFDGGESLARQKEASAQARATEAGTRALAARLPTEFESWKRKFLYNVSLYRARQRTVEKSEESTRLATIGVKAGTRTHTEALDAELDLFRARAGVVQAQAAAVEALSNLELAVGHHL